MVRRCRLPAGLDVQLISSKPRLVQMWRTGPRGAPQSTRTVAAAMRALVDTAQILLLACGLSQVPHARVPPHCSRGERTHPMSDHDGVEPVPEASNHHVSRRGVTGPCDTSNGHRAAQNDKLLFFDYTGTRLVPNIARAWEVSPDGKVTTLHLRRGMKWSDGHPFTADDFVFWFEDVYSNREVVPTPLSVMSINGKPIAVKKVDASTVQFVAPDPYYALPTVLASVWGIGHHARFGRDALGGFAPAHYLKQFHPKYASKDDLAKKLADAKFENWVLLL